jgi:Spy/CpxP family protein refolding chaperone
MVALTAGDPTSLQEMRMRKMSILSGLALALSLGAAGVASAQSAAAPEHARAGQRGPEMLFRGITLTPDQKARIKTIHEKEHKEFAALREKNKDGRSAQVRQRGDTTGFGARRAQMEQRREQQFAELRSVLNSNQRAQFDKNVADMKARFAQRGHKGDKEHGRRSGEGDTNQSR